MVARILSIFICGHRTVGFKDDLHAQIIVDTTRQAFGGNPRKALLAMSRGWWCVPALPGPETSG